MRVPPIDVGADVVSAINCHITVRVYTRRVTRWRLSCAIALFTLGGWIAGFKSTTVDLRR